MLINLSNHPVEKWSKEQYEEALKQYGEIVDLPFPSINPEAPLEEIQSLVNEYVQRTLDKFDNRKMDETHAVHLMGEYTFSYQFAKTMEIKNIMCISSTTNREVKENTDCSKTTVFSFVKFRPYFLIKDKSVY